MYTKPIFLTIKQEDSQQMKNVCIFDLDGTLADTVESIAQAVNRGLEHFGYESRLVEEYKYYAGDGLNTALQRALHRAGDTEGHCLKEGIPLVRQWLAQEPLYRVKPFPGIAETLAGMKKLGVSLAVLSNKPHPQAVQVTETLFGKGYFDKIQGQMEGIAQKPDPAGAFQIARELGADPKSCLYIGDTNTDMLTGRRAGMYTVGVTWGFREQKELEESGADRIVHKPEELLLLMGG